MDPILPGKVNIQIVSGDSGHLLSKLHGAGVFVYHLKEIDELTLQCVVARQDLNILEEIIHRTGAEVTVLAERGFYHYFKRALRRSVLLLGIVTLLICTLYFPKRIYFVEVKGNVHVPTMKIVETAENNGIFFGASREDIRSEKVKNALISEIPELQWVGVNTYGCVAQISVEEKALPQEVKNETEISSIVAATDGIVRDITVTQGNPLCTVGQAVKKGQVLISGYRDCGLLVIQTRAEGEVYAETRRTNIAVTPLLHQARATITTKNTKFSLQIGKKLINFYNGSGISGSSCVKMYKKEYVRLPGGFYLPIAWISETVVSYQVADSDSQNPDEFDWLSDQSRNYLIGQTVAGEVLANEEKKYLDNGVCTIQGYYTCFEMIGRKQNEESVLKNGSNG